MTIPRWFLAFAVLAFPGPCFGQQGAGPASNLRRELEEILKSGEYDSVAPRPRIPESFWDWLARKLGSLFRSLSTLAEASPIVYWGILVACLAILVVILAHGATVAFQALQKSRASAVAVDNGRTPDAASPTSLLEQAAIEAGCGRFAEAIRLCHGAALAALSGRGLVGLRESLTCAEYAGQLRAQEPERSVFLALTRLYEPVCFGRAPAGGREFEESRELAQKLLSGTES